MVNVNHFCIVKQLSRTFTHFQHDNYQNGHKRVEENFNFCQNISLPPTPNLTPRRDLDRIFGLTFGIQAAHFLAIYSYIGKHDVGFYIRSLDFLPGLPNFKG